MQFPRALIASVRECMELCPDATSIAARLNIDVSVIIQIISSLS